MTATTRFERKLRINEQTGCWEWLGRRQRQGYGVFDVRCGTITTPALAHRVSYELFVGPIPEGLVLDHLCAVKGCVNPAHLEAVTAAENSRRWHATRTHCVHGHEFTPENTRARSDGRRCRACDRKHNQKNKTSRRHSPQERADGSRNGG